MKRRIDHTDVDTELRIHEHTERRDNGALDVDFMVGGGCGGGKKVEKGV